MNMIHLYSSVNESSSIDFAPGSVRSQQFFVEFYAFSSARTAWQSYPPYFLTMKVLRSPVAMDELGSVTDSVIDVGL